MIHIQLLSMNHVKGGGKGSTQKRDAGLITQVVFTSDCLVLLLSGWFVLLQYSTDKITLLHHSPFVTTHFQEKYLRATNLRRFEDLMEEEGIDSWLTQEAEFE